MIISTLWKKGVSGQGQLVFCGLILSAILYLGTWTIISDLHFVTSYSNPVAKSVEGTVEIVTVRQGHGKSSYDLVFGGYR